MAEPDFSGAVLTWPESSDCYYKLTTRIQNRSSWQSSLFSNSPKPSPDKINMQPLRCSKNTEPLATSMRCLSSDFPGAPVHLCVLLLQITQNRSCSHLLEKDIMDH